MGSVNLVMLVGNVGADPEARSTTQGIQVANFTLATNDRKDHPPNWHRISCWEKTAEFVMQYIRKGSTVCVRGRISYRHDEKNDKWYTDIIADRVDFVGRRPEDADEVEPEQRTAAPRTGKQQSGGQQRAPRPQSADDDELPF